MEAPDCPVRRKGVFHAKSEQSESEPESKPEPKSAGTEQASAAGTESQSAERTESELPERVPGLITLPVASAHTAVSSDRMTPLCVH